MKIKRRETGESRGTHADNSFWLFHGWSSLNGRNLTSYILCGLVLSGVLVFVTPIVSQMMNKQNSLSWKCALVIDGKVYVSWKRKMLHDVIGGHQAYIQRKIYLWSLEFRSWLRPRAVSRLRSRFPRDKIIKSLRLELFYFILSGVRKVFYSLLIKR